MKRTLEVAGLFYFCLAVVAAQVTAVATLQGVVTDQSGAVVAQAEINVELHLIPLVLQVALGQREHNRIFGDDYDTPDGTCVRDYIHVCHLAQAHIPALAAQEQGSRTYNLGNGLGYSVKQVLLQRQGIKPISEQQRF